MHAHKTQVMVSATHEVTVKLPSDFPPGEAEVIVLAGKGRNPNVPTSFDDRFPRDPALSPIVFHEDPTTPLSDEDWPVESRP
jgi:hypothetical protein